MRAPESAKLGIVVLIAFVPSYVVQRITEYYFLAGDANTYFAWSGDRTILFISCMLLGAVASGYASRRLTATASAYTAGIVLLLSLVYYLCTPKVCYSTGGDGLEPLRFGYFFSCLGIAGVSVGNHIRTRTERTGILLFTVSGATMVAITYYPVVFTIAGAKLVAPLDPIPLLVVVFLSSLVFASKVTHRGNWVAGLTVPLAAELASLAIILPMAAQYLAQISIVATIIVLTTLAGAVVGSYLAIGSRTGSIHARVVALSNKLLYIALLILLLSTTVFLPDATAALVPLQGSSSPYAIGPTVYVGGFATQSFLRLSGVSVDVSFAGTNASSIQADNFLAGGLGVHAAHCCVDGIDFGYRFDTYLFHDGSEALVATAWEMCDWNMACGGHSWQDLLFVQKESISAPLASKIHLSLEWKGRAVYWSYAVDQSPASNFTNFIPPPEENAYFTVGTLGDVPASTEPPRDFYPNSLLGAVSATGAPGYYFFQYGLMSRYPIDRPGWAVSFACPSYLANVSWTCVRHSDSVQGDQSYWKVIWRWGEPYYHVAAVSNGKTPNVTFSYSSSTIPSFSPFW